MSDWERRGDQQPEDAARPDEAAPPLVEPDPVTHEPADAVPVEVEPASADPAVIPDETPLGTSTGADPESSTGDGAAPTTAVPSPQVVYVATPQPPRARGNRGVGLVLALLGAVLFALLYAGVVAALIAVFLAPETASEEITGFVGSAAFWVPILFFSLAFVLVVLLLNRAGWWAHVLGSLVVAVLVYFGTIGMLLLLENVVVLTPAEAGDRFATLATSPVVIAATLVAREVSIWIGFLIARRGRRLVARNAEARDAFDREQAERRAEYERASANGA